LDSSVRFWLIFKGLKNILILLINEGMCLYYD